jgi:hypothetical protein
MVHGLQRSSVCAVLAQHCSRAAPALSSAHILKRLKLNIDVEHGSLLPLLQAFLWLYFLAA